MSTRLSIEDLATSQCQVVLKHTKDMTLRRVKCKLPNLADFFAYFEKIIYYIKILKNRFKEQKEKCRTFRSSYMQVCKHYFEIRDSPIQNLMA